MEFRHFLILKKWTHLTLKQYISHFSLSPTFCSYMVSFQIDLFTKNLKVKRLIESLCTMISLTHMPEIVEVVIQSQEVWKIVLILNLASTASTAASEVNTPVCPLFQIILERMDSLKCRHEDAKATRRRPAKIFSQRRSFCNITTTTLPTT